MQKVSIFAALLAALFASQAKAEMHEVEVTGGHVAGVAADGVVSFKGIPFAAPPIGRLRWTSPQPVNSWTGVKQAASFAPGCMQNASFTDSVRLRRSAKIASISMFGRRQKQPVTSCP